MSLYNMLHGGNPLAPILLKVLDIDQPAGNYESGRFRDIYLNSDASKIILYTRNGGGNRDDYESIFGSLAEHPNYLTDYDDDYDCTYAYIEFSVPKKYQTFLKQFATGEEPQTVHEKFQQTMREMDNMTKEQMENDPRFAPLVGVMEDFSDYFHKD